ncbi:MAG: hypothetical protein H6741_11095 [Alphaproteobacteria bacterium]|nr:hypothetical protein [Alphaproteobacteria bacterium]
MRLTPWLAALMTLGCGEREYTREELCAGEGPASLELGSGTGEVFDPFVDGQEVYISIAPQGGFGVTVRARSFGLIADAPVSLFLSSSHEGESTGTFEWGEIPLYCMDDGSGLLWGAVIPFAPELFPTEEDLEALDGELVTLEAEATDLSGEVVVGRSEVVVRLRE